MASLLVSSPAQVPPAARASLSMSHQKNTYFPQGLLRKIACTALVLLTRRGVSCLEDVTVHPATMPLDPTQSHSDDGQWGLNFLADTWKEGQPFCHTPIDRFKDFTSKENEEERSLAQYYYGKRLACTHHEEDPNVMSGEQYHQLWKEREHERLQGLALMYKTGHLKVLYPQEAHSFYPFLLDYVRYEDLSSEYYLIRPLSKLNIQVG